MEPNPNKSPSDFRQERIVWRCLIAFATIGLFSMISIDSGFLWPWEIERTRELAREDKATLDEQAIYVAFMTYRKREGKLPTSAQILKEVLENGSNRDPWGDPWGKMYQLEIRKNQETGVDEPVIWTVSPKGHRIQWPRQ